MSIEHVTLFMADGPQRCVKEDWAPCSICGGATFVLSSVASKDVWTCYTHRYDHPEQDSRQEAASTGRTKVVNLSEYRAKKAGIQKKRKRRT